MLRDSIEVNCNVFITARERGKKVPSLCRAVHNVWTNLGRRYLAEVISPADNTFTAHYGDNPIRVVRYIGVGVGGNKQRANLPSDFPAVNDHYPGQNTFTESLGVQYLERPVKVSGTPGRSGTTGVWMKNVIAPPSFETTGVTFSSVFAEPDLHLLGAYPSVPLSEIGLFLSSYNAELPWDDVYIISPPDYINVATRPRVVAYATFDTLCKTPSVALEFSWIITF